MSHFIHRQQVGFFISYLLLLLPGIAFVQIKLFSSELIFGPQLVSFIGIVLIALILISWKAIGGRLLCPYIITIVSLYFVLCGQSVLWSFGLDAGYRDLLQSAYWNIADIEVCRALWYTYGCISVAHLAAVLSTISRMRDGQKNSESGTDSEVDETLSNETDDKYAAIATSGIILLVLGAVPFGMESLRSYTSMQLGGYAAQYFGASLGGILGLAADLFPCGALCLLLSWGRGKGSKGSYNAIKSSIAYFIVFFTVLSNLITGKRTIAILFALAIAMIRYSYRPIKKRAIFALAVISVIGMVALRGIDMWRSGNSESVFDVITYLLSGEGNPAIDFMGDVGWNLLSTVKVQEMIPSLKAYSFGLSYIASFAGFIPNLGQWSVNPAAEFSDLGNWLQGALGISYGPGFSPVAEAWYNFGCAGILVFVLWGTLLAWLSKKSDEISSPISQLIVVLYIGIVLKSAVRSCFFPTLRSGIALVIFTLLMVQVCLMIIRQGKGSTNEHRNCYLV